jgi:mannose-6-phosphate isomerase
LGTSLNITVDEEIPYLEELLASYQDKLRFIEESTGLKDPLKIAILTGYSLCDELHRAREEERPGPEAPETEETFQRTLKLITRLEEAITRDPPPRGLCLLKNPVKHYEWGSPRWIPEILGEDNPGGEPWAELWMGAHPASSSVLRAGKADQSLARLIAADPPGWLGEEWANSGTLPFLFKLLAASRPLSIQAHPGKEQARQGWLRENERGVPLDAPERNYRDDNHKPEIICALSPFTALCGFRHPAEIGSLLSSFFANAPLSLQSGFAPLWASLGHTGEGAMSALRDFLKSLFAVTPELRRELTSYALSASPAIEGELGALVRSFAEFYPGDPGILSPLYLNLIHLESGQAIYLPAGILHSYVEGFGVELMANSDNVLRGGLSSKHIDLNELMRILYFHPFMPELLSPPPLPPLLETEAPENPAGQGVFTYPSPCREFSLSVIGNLEGPFPFRGPAIIIVTRGVLRVSSGEDSFRELKRGESAFIPPGARLSLGGDYSLCAASVPPAGQGA